MIQPIYNIDNIISENKYLVAMNSSNLNKNNNNFNFNTKNKLVTMSSDQMHSTQMQSQDQMQSQKDGFKTFIPKDNVPIHMPGALFI